MTQFKIDSRINIDLRIILDSRIKKDLSMEQRSYFPPQLKTETSSSYYWGRGSEGKEFRAGKESKECKETTSWLTKILNFVRVLYLWMREGKFAIFFLKRFANQGWLANKICKSRMIRESRDDSRIKGCFANQRWFSNQGWFESWFE